MKRYILAAWCIAFSLGLYAQKALIIHKKDGTKIEIPTKGIEGFYFTGKALVRDNDYTQMERYVVHTPNTPTKTLDLSIYFLVHSGMEFDDIGVCYSTQSGDVSNKASLWGGDTYIRYDGNVTGSGKIYGTDTYYKEIHDLEYETTYYCRTYVNYQGNYYYSDEHSIHTGKPKMGWYGVKVDPADYATTGYVMPSEAAWEKLTATSKLINHYSDFLIEEWNRCLTSERIEALKPQCKQKLECMDGTIYVLETIDEEFVAHLIALCGGEVNIAGSDAEYAQTSEPVEVTCGAEWGVPGNMYWEYYPATVTGNPFLTFASPTPLLANYKYKLELVLAPKTEEGEKLPNKFNISFENEERVVLTRNSTNDPTQCTVYTLEVTTTKFVKSGLIMQGKVGAREKGFDRILRVAHVKMTPIGPVEE